MESASAKERRRCRAGSNSRHSPTSPAATGPGVGVLPPVPLLPGGRPCFYLSQPQLEEPWFFRVDSSQSTRSTAALSGGAGTVGSCCGRQQETTYETISELRDWSLAVQAAPLSAHSVGTLRDPTPPHPLLHLQRGRPPEPPQPADPRRRPRPQLPRRSSAGQLRPPRGPRRGSTRALLPDEGSGSDSSCSCTLGSCRSGSCQLRCPACAATPRRSEAGSCVLDLHSCRPPAAPHGQLYASSGYLHRNLATSFCSGAVKNKSLSPAPSFTFLDEDAVAAAAARSHRVSFCASKPVLKISATFCASFLLGMLIAVVYIEVYLWRQES